jgi:hypothetical protein
MREDVLTGLGTGRTTHGGNGPAVELSTRAADDAPSVRLAGSSAASSWKGGLGGLCRRVFIVCAHKEPGFNIFCCISTIILLLGRCKLI